MATKSQSASFTDETFSVCYCCCLLPSPYGYRGNSQTTYDLFQQSTACKDQLMTSAFHYFHQWEQQQLTLWEQEQADKQQQLDLFDELNEFEDFEDFE
jgi:hypothetical protein